MGTKKLIDIINKINPGHKEKNIENATVEIPEAIEVIVNKLNPKEEQDQPLTKQEYEVLKNFLNTKSENESQNKGINIIKKHINFAARKVIEYYDTYRKPCDLYLFLEKSYPLSESDKKQLSTDCKESYVIVGNGIFYVERTGRIEEVKVQKKVKKNTKKNINKKVQEKTQVEEEIKIEKNILENVFDGDNNIDDYFKTNKKFELNLKQRVNLELNIEKYYDASANYEYIDNNLLNFSEQIVRQKIKNEGEGNLSSAHKKLLKYCRLFHLSNEDEFGLDDWLAQYRPVPKKGLVAEKNRLSKSRSPAYALNAVAVFDGGAYKPIHPTILLSEKDKKVKSKIPTANFIKMDDVYIYKMIKKTYKGGVGNNTYCAVRIKENKSELFYIRNNQSRSLNAIFSSNIAKLISPKYFAREILVYPDNTTASLHASGYVSPANSRRLFGDDFFTEGLSQIDELCNFVDETDLNIENIGLSEQIQSDGEAKQNKNIYCVKIDFDRCYPFSETEQYPIGYVFYKQKNVEKQSNYNKQRLETRLMLALLPKEFNSFLFDNITLNFSKKIKQLLPTGLLDNVNARSVFAMKSFLDAFKTLDKKVQIKPNEVVKKLLKNVDEYFQVLVQEHPENKDILNVQRYKIRLSIIKTFNDKISKETKSPVISENIAWQPDTDAYHAGKKYAKIAIFLTVVAAILFFPSLFWTIRWFSKMKEQARNSKNIGDFSQGVYDVLSKTSILKPTEAMLLQSGQNCDDDKDNEEDEEQDEQQSKKSKKNKLEDDFDEEEKEKKEEEERSEIGATEKKDESKNFKENTTKKFLKIFKETGGISGPGENEENEDEKEEIDEKKKKNEDDKQNEEREMKDSEIDSKI